MRLKHITFIIIMIVAFFIIIPEVYLIIKNREIKEFKGVDVKKPKVLYCFYIMYNIVGLIFSSTFCLNYIRKNIEGYYFSDFNVSILMTFILMGFIDRRIKKKYKIT